MLSAASQMAVCKFSLQRPKAASCIGQHANHKCPIDRQVSSRPIEPFPCLGDAGANCASPYEDAQICTLLGKKNGPSPKWQNIKLLMVLKTNHWSGNKQELNP